MGKKIIRVSPSILACDFKNLDKEMNKIIKAKADWVHLDVMDGVFVNNISFGTPIAKAIKDYPIFKDVHLMICDPLKYVDVFASLGADLITFHLETVKSKRKIKELINKIHNLGLACGISIKPNTEVSEILPYLASIDLVLVMSVEPGFGGQSFMENALPKIKELREYIDNNCLEALIEVDGGIDNNTGKKCIENGADVLVAGSYIFKNENIKEAIKSLKKA